MKESLFVTSLISFFNDSQNIEWKKIHLRINMLMKLILLETKKHNLQHVYKLQNYLINSNEAKIFLLYLSIARIYYLNYDKIKYELTNINTKNIISNLYQLNKNHNQLNSIYDTINRSLKQSLVYICIKPVWKARLVKNLNKHIHNKFIYNKYCEYSFFFINKYLKKKLMSYVFIDKFINEYLSNRVYLSDQFSYNIQDIRFTNWLKQNELIRENNKNNFLSNLIYHILINDLNWHLFNSLKKESIQNQIPIYKKITYNQKKVIKFSNYKIIMKDKRNINRSVIKFCKNFYNKIDSFINIKESNRLNFHVSQTLDTLIKKQSNRYLKKGNILYKTRTINLQLNKFLYINNLNSKYII